ncbi:hypothetical protein GN244_ATG06936 [Phytophthora infestans]|uniref:Uncharacterized protein n=1 Tax=Phytophthora infestans TaxID=4787 RepID=A0A833W3F8_PHYIN|nr:hypothetical protein GN244_ATG06936 [Phytophthora infestans]KAF4147981.1 hypothetical protein GN958_ATG02791 [Phytophthora infestans]
MECKSPLKMRWTTVEATMLTEEWAGVCASPDYKVLTGEDVSQVVFERYNSRCARTRQLRRSPQAVAVQRDRMARFAQFVADFDRTELPHGRRAWFDLSSEEQLQFDIPNEWRRQLATFTLDMLDTFKRYILPAENAHFVAKRKTAKKRSMKHKKASSRVSSKRRELVVCVEHQPCWQTEEEIALILRWGKFMKHKGLTLAEFEIMAFDKSHKCLAMSSHSSFSAWRKLRTLLSSWRFIHDFNAKHQPGWFELTEAERDLLIAWGELPDNFEDIERDVFIAMEGVSPKGAYHIKEERATPVQPPGPPSPKAISPLQSAAPGPIPLLTDLCPKGFKTDDNIEQFLLDEDVADGLATRNELRPDDCVIEPLGGRSFVPDTCILITEASHGLTEVPAVKQEVTDAQPLEPAPINSVAGAVKLLETRGKVHADIHQLRVALEEKNKRTLEYFEALSAEQFANANGAGLLNYVKLMLEQQNKRLLSVLHLADDIGCQNEAEIASFMQNWLGNSPYNGDAGRGVVAHVSAQRRMTGSNSDVCSAQT